MPRTSITAAWTMLLIACVVLLAIAAGALAFAMASPSGSLAQLDAWRGVVASSVALVVSATALAVLTLVRVNHGDPVDGVDAELMDAAPHGVVVVETTPPTRI